MEEKKQAWNLSDEFRNWFTEALRVRFFQLIFKKNQVKLPVEMGTISNSHNIDDGLTIHSQMFGSRYQFYPIEEDE